MPVYRVTIAGKTYTVEVPNPHERPVRAIVDGEVVEVEIAPAEGAPSVAPSPPPSAAQPAAPAASAAKPPSTSGEGRTYEVKAPLPGTITVVSVSEGERVERGQELCVIEAMKMNNPIRATAPGVVKEIFVTVGQQVQHGAPLLTIEG